MRASALTFLARTPMLVGRNKRRYAHRVGGEDTTRRFATLDDKSNGIALFRRFTQWKLLSSASCQLWQASTSGKLENARQKGKLPDRDFKQLKQGACCLKNLHRFTRVTQYY